MGCQGEIYAIYGIIVKAEIEQEDGENPVIYSVNGHTLCDDYEDAEFYNGIPDEYYGTSDLSKLKLVSTILGQEGSDALIGYVVCNESYLACASPLPPTKSIENQGSKLISEIKEKFGLVIGIKDLGLHLLFDSLNRF